MYCCTDEKPSVTLANGQAITVAAITITNSDQEDKKNVSSNDANDIKVINFISFLFLNIYEI